MAAMSNLAAPTLLLGHAGHVDHVARLAGTNAAPGFFAALALVAVAAVAVRRALLPLSRDGLMAAVALCSAGAGAVHALVTPEHFQEHAAFGLFFLGVTLWQMAVVVAALHRPSRALWTSTAVGTVAVLAIWAASRTTGLPFGPEAWMPEPTGFLDLACGAYEVAVVAACLRLALEPALSAAQTPIG